MNVEDNCIFCKIANDIIPSLTIYEDEYLRAIMDINPATKGHILILTKGHYENICDIPDDILSKVTILSKKIARTMLDVLTEGSTSSGVNIIQNNGAVAGQTVIHYHLHIIPRYEDDGQVIGWIPSEANKDELISIHNKLIFALSHQ